MSFSPVYAIHRYRDDIFKVVAFKRRWDTDCLIGRQSDDHQVNDTKLDSNFSRARNMVLQYALCNPWDYFFTGTLDPEKWQRNNLDAFMTDFAQKIRDWRKDYGVTFQVLLIPEHHKDGAWHVHGLIRGLPRWCLYGFYWIPLHDFGMNAPFPKKLCNGNFLYWADFMDRYGFCSLAPIKDPIATAFYISKYVSKDLSRRAGDKGKHLYFHSRPLKKAEKASDIWLYNETLEEFCVNDYDFCKTGMVEDAHWSFPFVWDGAEFPLEDAQPPKMLNDPLKDFPAWEIDPFYEQTMLQGFTSSFDAQKL